MFGSLTFVTCLSPFVALAGEEKCISYAPDAVVAGTLERHTFPGRPNYESIAKGDEAESGFYMCVFRMRFAQREIQSPLMHIHKRM